jgi:hypothetical protein
VAWEARQDRAVDVLQRWLLALAIFRCFWGGVVAWLSLVILRMCPEVSGLDLSEGAASLSGHPVAQAPPGRAAPAWSSWSTPRLNELDQAGAVWLPPGVRWVPAGLRHPRAAGSRAGSPAAGGIFPVQGRRPCPPEA